MSLSVTFAMPASIQNFIDRQSRCARLQVGRERYRNAERGLGLGYALGVQMCRKFAGVTLDRRLDEIPKAISQGLTKPAFRGDTDNLPRRLLRRCDRRVTPVGRWQHFLYYQGYFALAHIAPKAGYKCTQGVPRAVFWVHHRRINADFTGFL
jgi:hypothetical protein